MFTRVPRESHRDKYRGYLVLDGTMSIAQDFLASFLASGAVQRHQSGTKRFSQTQTREDNMSTT